MDINTLAGAVWALAGCLFWGLSLATYVILVEQRRRKRTETEDDDWRIGGK